MLISGRAFEGSEADGFGEGFKGDSIQETQEG
jgi:hypothetical protein